MNKARREMQRALQEEFNRQLDTQLYFDQFTDFRKLTEHHIVEWKMNDAVQPLVAFVEVDEREYHSSMTDTFAEEMVAKFFRTIDKNREDAHTLKEVQHKLDWYDKFHALMAEVKGDTDEPQATTCPQGTDA